MIALRQALLLLFLTALAAVGTQYLHPRAPQWYLSEEPLKKDEVTLQMVGDKWQGHVLWIDARIRSQYEAGHVPSALSLNEEELDTQLTELFPLLQDNTKPVVVYCGSEACHASRKMADYLRERLPTEEIYVLRGGWSAWSSAHGPGLKGKDPGAEK